ncbi:MAG TPA: DUF1844 domain-containing protein [Thermodesulfobacteriota bacterium]|nr:DUF1844 domain-containing protein [Thermodesulfobacteriota bacterium]
MGNKEEEEKGFIVRDRRFAAQKEEAEEAAPKKGEQREESKVEDASQKETPLPEINFTNFLLSISTSALFQLGEIPDPTTKQSVKELPLAKQTIDLIGMLKEKTKGNLTPEEEKLIEYVLYDLRMRYVKAAG